MPRSLCISAFLLVAGATCFAQTAFVRVNQVGYPVNASKRAYLMTSTTETGATFKLTNSSGASVFNAAIGQKLGAWGSFSNVYALDFDSVTTPGTYTITVTGPAPATSPSFLIDLSANVYSTPLANSLYFYQNERDGANFIASPLRSAGGHLNDATASVYLTPNVNKNGRFSGDLTPTGAQMDASGGWWDAGDYLKFVQTESYTTALMLIGVRDFPSQMGSSAPASTNFTSEAKFGTDWLQKMWNDSSKTFYYQVGIGNGNAQTISDHDIWRLPQSDDTFQSCTSQYRYICDRPVFINTAGGAGAKISPNLAGRMAAALAVCYQVFKTTQPAYANQCLLSAEHIFDLANTAPSGKLLTVIPFSFYPESEWRDDLELGATELYLALQSGNVPAGLPHPNASFYLTAAAEWANSYITGPGDAGDTLNLYDVSGLAHYELYRALGLAGNPSGLATTQAALLADLKKQIDKAVAQAATDPFGFGFPWAAYDTTSHGAGLVVMANEYDNLTNSAAYAAYANRWLGNILGTNAWGTSLIVGDGSVFPHCMQHQVANLAGSLNGTEPLLRGAAVEGPNSISTKGALGGMIACPTNGVDVFAQFNGNGAVFKDNVQSYSTVEPAVDLTASSFLAFSWTIAGAPSGTP
ncbi:MAG TPA: glycoside hydrolase family 9 protein [Candidatus Acidoferrum sp.]|nr:glycoside hydrolase family 9 protein [Candidatus Acidoferrum sp.]